MFGSTDWLDKRRISILLLFQLIHTVSAQQINLGTFGLGRNPVTGDLQLGFGQGGNIFGFGADRLLGLNLGPGRFGARSDQGLLLGGGRFGLDSHLGYQEGQGLNLGNILNLFQPLGSQRQPPAIASVSSSSASSRAHPPVLGPSPESREESQEQFPAAMPTLIPQTAKWPNPLMESPDKEEQFPESTGAGWQSREEEMGLKVDEPEAGTQRRITTEGKFSNDAGPVEQKANEFTNDGSTGNNSKKQGKGLPVPDGLEPWKLKKS